MSARDVKQWHRDSDSQVHCRECGDDVPAAVTVPRHRRRFPSRLGLASLSIRDDVRLDFGVRVRAWRVRRTRIIA
jgi:hypothetical protein